MILGLDISTSATGWCLTTMSGEFVDMGAIQLTNTKNIFEKAKVVRETLEAISTKYKVKNVAVEENLQGFRRGLSSARTLVTLARFNGIVSYIASDVFLVQPTFFSVVSARKELGLKIQREKLCGVSTKQQVLDWVTIELSDTKWTWPNKILKSGPRKGLTILEPTAYDMADAYVMARSGHLNIVAI